MRASIFLQVTKAAGGYFKLIVDTIRSEEIDLYIYNAI
jgi:hypothetical protein